MGVAIEELGTLFGKAVLVKRSPSCDLTLGMLKLIYKMIGDRREVMLFE